MYTMITDIRLLNNANICVCCRICYLSVRNNVCVGVINLANKESHMCNCWKWYKWKTMIIQMKRTRILIFLIVLLMMAVIIIFLTNSGSVQFRIRGFHPEQWPGYRDCLPAEKVSTCLWSNKDWLKYVYNFRLFLFMTISTIEKLHRKYKF